MPSEIDGVRLQLAMAFGQGAGSMLANGEALERLLEEQGGILDNALADWSASRFAFTELVRTLGHMSASRAATAGRAQIEWPDIDESLPEVLVLCPCAAAPRRHFTA